jgi:hypothetical protein
MDWKSIKNHRDLSKVINKVCYQVLMKRKTEFVMQKDWDNLILLDACRYDMFMETNTIPGRLDHIYSKGSSTGHFLLENFKGKSFLDTVYVTANPLVNYHVKDSFYLIIPVWMTGWDDHHQTILPDTMVKHCLDAYKKYPDKRLVFHFMQPHFPFLDADVREIIGEHDGVLSRNLFLGGKIEHRLTVWEKFRTGRLDKRTVWEAYQSNLKIVLRHISDLIKNLSGKSVISSDHANLFGEWLFPLPIREFGHPGGLYKKNLLKVPWFVIESGKRRTIKKNKKRKKSYDIDPLSEEYIKKLSPLGYM